jgi:NMD protein affecting ribosome stability and mRNA decay
MKRCPICNRSSEEVKFYGEFCVDCAGARLKSKLQSEIEMTVCKDCGRVKVAGVFIEINKENIELLLRSILKHYSVKLVHFGNGIARVKVKEEGREGPDVEMNIRLKQLSVLCDSCAKKRSGYYEAVVQLRGEEGKVERTAGALSRYLEKNGAFITKAEGKEHGVDIFTSDKKVTLAFISSRHLKWKGSFELHGEKGGRRLYRNTYFISLSAFAQQQE